MMLGPGTGCGRRMGDVTSVFVIQLYELYEGTADRALLSELFPAAARGARWAMRNADNGTGLPQGLQCTYDQYGFQVRPSLKTETEDGLMQASAGLAGLQPHDL